MKKLLSKVLDFDESLNDDVFCLYRSGTYPPNDPKSDKGSFWCCLEAEVFGDIESEFCRYPYQEFCLGGYLFLTIPKFWRDKFLAFLKKHNESYYEVSLYI